MKVNKVASIFAIYFTVSLLNSIDASVSNRQVHPQNQPPRSRLSRSVPRSALELPKREFGNEGDRQSQHDMEYFEDQQALVDPSLSRLMKRSSVDDSSVDPMLTRLMKKSNDEVDPMLTRLMKRDNEFSFVDPSLTRLMKRHLPNFELKRESVGGRIFQMRLAFEEYRMKLLALMCEDNKHPPELCDTLWAKE